MPYVEYLQQDDPVAFSRCNTKLSVLGLDLCPYDLPADLKINDPTNWPDVYHYLTETPGELNIR
jgi:hypothetical protein